MGVTRRQFLQQAGLALAAWGVSEAGLWTVCDRYQQVLAAPTSRKLALLIGINQYPFVSGLEGCITDVELQRELLTHRFGFQPTDILTLTDWQATREAVTTGFVEHLTQQAQAGDVVVVHYSGMGSTVAGGAANSTRSSLVMADATPTGEIPIVNDLLVETLGLLLRSLKTDRISIILDTSHTYLGNPLQGNLRVRAYPNPSTAQPSPAELELQANLLTQLSLKPELVTSDLSQFAGVVLTAASLAHVATEMRWNRFSAGLFTNALTQALWQATPATTIRVCFNQAAQQVEPLVGQQQPQLSGQRPTKRQADKLAPYFAPLSTVGADGVITAIEEGGNTVQLWLGGFAASLLEHYGVNSLLAIAPVTGDTAPIMLQITAREGFTAKAKRLPDPTNEAEPLRVGQLVQEAVRVLPRNIGLTVALDGSLERIERIDAISAFTTVPRVSSAIAGEQPADFLFSKVRSQPTQLASASNLPIKLLAIEPTPISYGLFTPGRDVILSTTGEGGEAIKVAVRRLVPKLQTLLATKLLNLTVNHHTSQVAVAVQLEQVAPQIQVLERQTSRASSTVTTKGMTNQATIPKLVVGSRIRYCVDNAGTQPLYTLAIALDSASNLLWLYVPTPQPDTASTDGETVMTAIAPTSSTVLPTTLAGAEWQVQGTTGLAETYLIFSRSPFAQTIATLTSQQHTGNSAIVGSVITNPLDVVQAILQDLHQTSEPLPSLNTSEFYGFDVNTWATLRFTYQIA